MFDKKRVKIVLSENCTGCSLCKNICPVNAIVMESDKEGFWYPAIDKLKCVNCGECEEACPVHKKNIINEEKNKINKIYAAWSLDSDIRYNSTSGGIYSELALAILKTGGYICGAIYDENHMVKHFITNKKEDLNKLRQSKYVQSDMTDIYIEIGNLLKQGSTLLFCGSPCQCEAVYKYCEKKKISAENLYLIDFICRGSNSPKVYRKFLDELESEYNNTINKVWFKNKTYGWNRFSTKIEFNDGEYYLKDRHQDIYIRGYIEDNLFIRPSCSNCYFKGFNRIADITLADFWGVQLEEHMEETDGGTSMVMVHTKKGEKIWNLISSKVYKKEKTLEDVIKGNVCFYNSVASDAHREEFMKALDVMSVKENIERFLKK